MIYWNNSIAKAARVFFLLRFKTVKVMTVKATVIIFLGVQHHNDEEFGLIIVLSELMCWVKSNQSLCLLTV